MERAHWVKLAPWIQTLSFTKRQHTKDEQESEESHTKGQEPEQGQFQVPGRQARKVSRAAELQESDFPGGILLDQITSHFGGGDSLTREKPCAAVQVLRSEVCNGSQRLESRRRQQGRISRFPARPAPRLMGSSSRLKAGSVAPSTSLTRTSLPSSYEELSNRAHLLIQENLPFSGQFNYTCEVPSAMLSARL